MTAKTRKTPPKPKPKTNQEQYDALKASIKDMGSVLWENECNVNLYQGTHLEVSAGGYVKYEFHGCDTPAKILEGLRTTHKGVLAAIKARRDELTDALNYAVEV